MQEYKVKERKLKRKIEDTHFVERFCDLPASPKIRGMQPLRNNRNNQRRTSLPCKPQTIFAQTIDHDQSNDHSL